MSSVLLRMHLGLGDHFLTHGIVREYAKKYRKVGVFAKHASYPTVAFMFRDLPNVEVIPVADDREAEAYIRRNIFKIWSGFDQVKVIGFERFEWNSKEKFERQFYQLAGVPFEKKWDSFHIERDRNREKDILNRLPKGEFAFVHDDERYPINPLQLNPDMTVFKPEKTITDNICDYVGVIEKASEIHVIDSSFMFFVDCLQYSNPSQKLFVHRYARKNKEHMLPILKKNWTILQSIS